MHTKTTQERISVDPAVMRGKPVIKGTRITVEQILRQLAQGMTVEEICKNYPHIKDADVHAVLDHAGDRIRVAHATR